MNTANILVNSCLYMGKLKVIPLTLLKICCLARQIWNCRTESIWQINMVRFSHRLSLYISFYNKNESTILAVSTLTSISILIRWVVFFLNILPKKWAGWQLHHSIFFLCRLLKCNLIKIRSLKRWLYMYK